jgi:hypothetical protein
MNRFWRLPVGNQWQQTRGKSSIKEVENSIPLRVLVMVLVILGIVAGGFPGMIKLLL